MRKALLVVLILSAAVAWAQGGCTGQKPLNGVTTGGYLQALANQKVRVCSDTLNPCTTVPLFSDAALTQVLANPVTTDAAGNYQYCAAAGAYNEQITSTGSVFAQVNNTPITVHPDKAYTDTPAPFAGLANALTAGTSSTALQVIGDSTGNETSEWPYLLTQYLATKYPAYTVKYWLWDDTITDFDPPTIIQTGTGGCTRTINFTGSVNGVRLGAEDIPTFTIGGAMDIRYCFAPSSWRPGSNVIVLAKFTAPYRTLRLDLITDGTLRLELSSDGTAVSSTTSSAAVTDTGANTSQCARVTWVPGSPSTVTYYTGTDNVTWTQLGTPQSTATNTISQANNGIYDVGVDDWTLMGGGFNGKVTSVEMRNGVNGPILNPRNIDAWQILDTATYSGAPELNVLNASMPGAGLAYWMTTSRQPFALTNFQQVVAMVSLSHNEGRSTGAGEMKTYGTLFSQIATATPTAHLIVLTQNPRTAPATFINEHAIRGSMLMSWTGSPVGYDVIDIRRAFINDPRWASSPSTLVNPVDGIHPCNGVTICIGNPAGEQLWATTVEAAFQRSLNSQSSVYTGSAALPSYLTSTTGTGSTVLSNSPTLTGSVTMATFTAIQRTINNAADADISDTIQCGLTVDKNCYTTYRGFSGTAYWQVGKASDNSWRLHDVVANVDRISAVSNGLTSINGVNSNAVRFNNLANSFGQVEAWSGGATPARVFLVDALGKIYFQQTAGGFRGILTGTWTADRTFTFQDASGTVPLTIASGTSAMGTGAITTGTCATVVTTAATNALSTDTISWAFNAAPGTGWPGLTVQPYVTANNVNFLVCNPTAGSLTPAAATLNWRVVR